MLILTVDFTRPTSKKNINIKKFKKNREVTVPTHIPPPLVKRETDLFLTPPFEHL